MMGICDRDEQAAGWVVRMERPDWSAADEAELQTWLAGDPRHRGALLQAQALWVAFEPAAITGSREGADDVGDGGEGLVEVRPGISRRWLLRGAGAAIAASLAGIFVFLADARYSTAVGEIRRVPLADGSIASINTDSAIEVALTNDRRTVELSRGEAWFQIAKDPKRPFVVASGRVRARAVGTAFSVRRREGGADILVTEGVVEAWADGAEGARVRLTAGQGAFVADNAAIRPLPPQPGGVDRTLAWRAGKIDLVSTPLLDAAAEFNRYNRRQIEIADPALKGEQLDGVFGISDPETFALAVRDGLAVPVDLTDPARIRIGREHQ